MVRKTRTLRAAGRAAVAALPAALALLIAIAAPGSVRAQEIDPCNPPPGEEVPQRVPAPVCGTTVVEGEGHTGITLDVPETMMLPEDNYEVELREEATYAFVGLADPDPGACGRDISPLFGMCLTHKIYMTRMPFGYSEGGLNPPRVNEGIQHLYVISDGPVRVTLKFDDLDGENGLDAKGSIQAFSEWLEPRCPTAPSCGSLGWGGATHVARDPGFVGVIAHSWNPGGYLIEDRVPYPGTRSATSCLYPSSGSSGGSTDPQDHPTGCAFTPTDEGDWLEHASWFASTSTYPFGATVRWKSENLNPDGPVYAGFTAQQVSTETPGGGYGAFAVWLEEGITGEPEPAETSS